MAQNVTAQVLGGQPKVVEANTVGEAKSKLNLSGNYTATINGEPAADADELDDYQFVSFAPAVKGGR